MPMFRLTLYDLDTENGRIEKYQVEMEATSIDEAENDDNFYEVAMEWIRDDLDCDVYSYEYYEWDEVE